MELGRPNSIFLVWLSLRKRKWSWNLIFVWNWYVKGNVRSPISVPPPSEFHFHLPRKVIATLGRSRAFRPVITTLVPSQPVFPPPFRAPDRDPKRLIAGLPDVRGRLLHLHRPRLLLSCSFTEAPPLLLHHNCSQELNHHQAMHPAATYKHIRALILFS